VRPALNETKKGRQFIKMRSKNRNILIALVAVFALSGLTAASALAAGAPIVETTAATGVVGTEATLNGTVSANGALTKYYFEYGTTTAYGSKTAEVSTIGAKIAATKVVAGLKPSTAYHFRLVATNANGSTNGADEAFTTTAPTLPVFAFQSPQKEVQTTFTASGGTASWGFGSGGFSCSGSTITGEFHVPKTVTGTVVFTGCAVNVGGNRSGCWTTGAKNHEEIVSQPLEGTLVYRSKTAKTVGIALKPTAGTAVVEHLECNAGKRTVTGSVFFPISTVNHLQSSFAISSSSAGEYETEGGAKQTAQLEETFGWGSVSWSFNDTLTTAKQVEIKA
jgi:hypothetical protein